MNATRLSVMLCGGPIALLLGAGNPPTTDLLPINRKVTAPPDVNQQELLDGLKGLDAQLSQCLNPALAADPKADRRVRLSLRVDEDGKLDDVRVHGVPGVLAVVLDGLCLGKALERSSLAPARAEIKFVYTFEYPTTPAFVAQWRKVRQDAWNSFCGHLGRSLGEQHPRAEATRLALQETAKTTQLGTFLTWSTSWETEKEPLSVESLAGDVWYHWDIDTTCAHIPERELLSSHEHSDLRGPDLFAYQRSMRPGGVDYVKERAAILRALPRHPSDARVAEANVRVTELVGRLHKEQSDACRELGGTPKVVNDVAGELHCEDLPMPTINWKTVKPDAKAECARNKGKWVRGAGTPCALGAVKGPESRERFNNDVACECKPGQCVVRQDNQQTCVPNPSWHGKEF